MEARLGEMGRTVSRSLRRLRRDAVRAGRTTKREARLAARRAEDAVLPSRKTLLGLGFLSSLMAGKSSGDTAEHPVRLRRSDVSDDVLEALAGRVERRLVESDRLRKALVRSMRDEARRGRPSRMGRMARMGLLVAAGYGIDQLVRQYTGKSAATHLRALAGSDRSRTAPARPQPRTGVVEQSASTSPDTYTTSRIYPAPEETR